jgi:hypothetical protein
MDNQTLQPDLKMKSSCLEDTGSERRPGSTFPTGNCTAGYYCGLGSSVPTPHDSDSFHVSYVGETCVEVNATAVNDMCPPGHSCPSGSIRSTFLLGKFGNQAS